MLHLNKYENASTAGNGCGYGDGDGDGYGDGYGYGNGYGYGYGNGGGYYGDGEEPYGTGPDALLRLLAQDLTNALPTGHLSHTPQATPAHNQGATPCTTLVS